MEGLSCCFRKQCLGVGMGLWCGLLQHPDLEAARVDGALNGQWEKCRR